MQRSEELWRQGKSRRSIILICTKKASGLCHPTAIKMISFKNFCIDFIFSQGAVGTWGTSIQCFNCKNIRLQNSGIVKFKRNDKPSSEFPPDL
jgi:hypothetical protein